MAQRPVGSATNAALSGTLTCLVECHLSKPTTADDKTRRTRQQDLEDERQEKAHEAGVHAMPRPALTLCRQDAALRSATTRTCGVAATKRFANHVLLSPARQRGERRGGAGLQATESRQACHAPARAMNSTRLHLLSCGRPAETYAGRGVKEANHSKSKREATTLQDRKA